MSGLKIERVTEWFYVAMLQTLNYDYVTNRQDNTRERGRERGNAREEGEICWWVTFENIQRGKSERERERGVN